LSKTITTALVAAAVLVAGVSAYASTQRGSSADRTPQGQDAAWLNQQSAALASLKASDGWSWLPGGVMWRRVKGDGTGVHPTVDDAVTLHYTGTLVDGTEFDSSAGGPPATFRLGQLIEAWQIAVPQAGVGDTIEIATPSDLAYGPYGSGPIPGGATLFFQIELLAVPGR